MNIDIDEAIETLYYTVPASYLNDKNNFYERMKKLDYAKATVRNYFREYRWHDLTKNPIDLPPDDERVLVYITWWPSGHSGYYTDAYYKGHWMNENITQNGTVEAWKLIDPID